MKRTLILCAHGAQSVHGRSTLAGLVNAVRREAPDLEVVDAFVDVQEPSIAVVLGKTSGPRIVVPLMLAYDRPVSVDIVKAAHLDPAVTVTVPLGPDWALAEIGAQRLIQAGARSDDTIVLAADVATDDRAVADIGRAAQLLSAVWGGRVHVGTLGGPDTPLADAIDVARAYGRRVVVSTYLLTPGSVHDDICAAGADVVTAPLLDGGQPDPRVVNLVLERVRSHQPAPPVGMDLGPHRPTEEATVGERRRQFMTGHAAQVHTNLRPVL
ncbi:cobalamin biosynthesis protein CbiX [Aeromicrobium sp. A1-2]|uniref:sirohydrochlorin chelatase n=1 Tax=Aeromicrobium sp. A1-2 TaxID=2107713 RepID=UPI000E4DCFBB|nr:CbiX/SirB N-terminal domain-containing protein [Aeromicrobium sp. A1-2]AXT85203.1 cobalamin biosynthesis protein CbiX [Aeromicrobium sp. A1-2]